MLILNVFLVFLIEFLDILFKYLINENSRLNIGIMKIIYIKNYGAAFGILSDNIMLFYMIFGLCVMMVTGLYYYCRNFTNFNINIPFLCVLIGGLGNFFDRINRGFVIDYIKLPIFSAVFNLSDCLICVGISILIYFFIT
ncbi:MAG: signal peptidase II [Candidatus Improbicoccus devescovinae]|nr:MAG: signal peptidase II [Candidatus Improbicoccus devescovinae]